MRSQRQPNYNCISLCSCRKARAHTFLPRQPTACLACWDPPCLGGGDWNCVANDQDLIGGQPGTRQAGFQHGLLPLQQALGLQDAFRHLHPSAREFTHTATSGSSSARIDRWLVTDSLLPDVNAATVSDIKPSDHYGISLSISPAAAPPRGPGIWAMPPSIITHPAFKILMTAQIQAFMLACPLSAAVSRAVRWDQLKAHIQDVARNYCSTFHAERTRQLWGWLVPFESSLELQEPLWQQCTTPKEAWLQALQETLHHVRPTRSC